MPTKKTTPQKQHTLKDLITHLSKCFTLYIANGSSISYTRLITLKTGIMPTTWIYYAKKHSEVKEYFDNFKLIQREKAIEGAEGSVTGNIFLLKSMFKFIELEEQLKINNAKDAGDDAGDNKPKDVRITFAAGN